ncbi:MAG: four helix bundle protein [Bacteroidia bacterium]|nr:four helix bundle protein [Bacteroidia bacterium]
MHNISQLKIWNKAMELATDIYTATKTFRKEEVYGLTSQLRRAAVSVPSNIAEGAGRNSNKEFRQFLAIANGSCFELQTQIILSNKLSFISNEACEQLITKIEEIQKMNYSLQKTITV